MNFLLAYMYKKLIYNSTLRSIDLHQLVIQLNTKLHIARFCICPGTMYVYDTDAQIKVYWYDATRT